MHTDIITQNGHTVALVESDTILVTDTNGALDFAFSVQHETGSSRIALNKDAITQDFFILSTCMAGEILQKFTNYHIKFAVYGDFSCYTSKPLKDFMYESNCGNSFFFTASKNEALEKLAAAR